jgi:ABC-type antimicrobial peptide transport system permease subunit
VGTTRGQLRSIVRAEALIISLFGALEGLLLGMIFGWAIVAVLRSPGVTTLVLNDRPRKRYGYHTPREQLATLLAEDQRVATTP